MSSLFRSASTRTTSRAFTTEARVHPNILPYLHTRRLALRWLPPTVALLAVGYAANNYRQAASIRRAAAVAESERQSRERRELAAKMMDAYGDGHSMEDLERAVQMYNSASR